MVDKNEKKMYITPTSSKKCYTVKNSRDIPFLYPPPTKTTKEEEAEQRVIFLYGIIMAISKNKPLDIYIQVIIPTSPIHSLQEFLISLLKPAQIYRIGKRISLVVADGQRFWSPAPPYYYHFIRSARGKMRGGEESG